MKKKILVRDVVDRCYDKESKIIIRSAVKDYNKAELERKLHIVEGTNQNDDKTAEIYLSTRHVDGDGDIITPDGWDLTFYDMNPKGLWSHNPQELPVYKALWSKTDHMGLRQKIQFADTEFANDIWLLFKQGFISTFSAGFRATMAICKGEKAFDTMIDQFKGEWTEYDEKSVQQTNRIITEKTLFESSICNLPCNPYAMVLAINEGKIKLTDNTTKELKIEEYQKKYRDEGKISKTVFVPVVARTELPSAEEMKEMDKRSIESIIKSWSVVTEQKPFPNEHAFRINDPDGFEEMRRENDAFGSGISVIWGIYTEDGEKKTDVQAIRFDSSKFTFEQAKKWVSEHDYDTIEEEESTGEKKSFVIKEHKKQVTIRKAVMITHVPSILERVNKTLTETIDKKRGLVR